MYKINVGDFTVGETVYHNRCLSAATKGPGIHADAIPWDGTEYNPWDYEYVNGEFALEPIELPESFPLPSEFDRVEAQALYTAASGNSMITTGLFEKVGRLYRMGVYSATNVRSFKNKGLTQAEINEILG